MLDPGFHRVYNNYVLVISGAHLMSRASSLGSPHCCGRHRPLGSKVCVHGHSVENILPKKLN